MTKIPLAVGALLLLAVPVAVGQSIVYFRHRTLNDALIHAVKADDAAGVAGLLRDGADINTGDSTRFRSCAEANPPCTRRTPLVLSVQNHDIPMMILLLRHGADLNIPDAEGMTPLHCAAERGSLVELRILLDDGADPNVRDHHGDTPLINAAYRNHRRAAECLLASGADVNAKGFLGMSALARTIGFTDNLELMKILLAHGADVNTRSELGETPLHGAANYGRVQAMKLLLQAGADPGQRDRNGQTPLAIARGYGMRVWVTGRSAAERQNVCDRRAAMTKLLRAPALVEAAPR